MRPLALMIGVLLASAASASPDYYDSVVTLQDEPQPVMTVRQQCGVPQGPMTLGQRNTTPRCKKVVAFRKVQPGGGSTRGIEVFSGR